MENNYLSEINYDKLVEKSLKNVMIDSLKIARDEGLPGEHHFYITFKTLANGVNISDKLIEQYPDEMTIVIQHQYSNLIVDADKFSIDLTFGGVSYTLLIPYASVTYFADPYAKFGLKFESEDGISNYEDDNNFDDDKEIVSDNSDTEFKKVSSDDNVVALDAFRKK